MIRSQEYTLTKHKLDTAIILFSNGKGSYIDQSRFWIIANSLKLKGMKPFLLNFEQDELGVNNIKVSCYLKQFLLDNPSIQKAYLNCFPDTNLMEILNRNINEIIIVEDHPLVEKNYRTNVKIVSFDRIVSHHEIRQKVDQTHYFHLKDMSVGTLGRWYVYSKNIGCVYQKSFNEDGLFVPNEHNRGCSFCFENKKYIKANDFDNVDFMHSQILNGLKLFIRDFYLLDLSVLYLIPQLIDKLISQNIKNINIFISLRVDILQQGYRKLINKFEELKANKIGVHFYLIGIESFNQDSLKLFNKGISSKSNVMGVYLLAHINKKFSPIITTKKNRSHGFILFHPWSTINQLFLDLKKVLECRFNSFRAEIYITKLKLIHETALYYKSKKENILENEFPSKTWSRVAQQGSYSREKPWRFINRDVHMIYSIINSIHLNHRNRFLNLSGEKILFTIISLKILADSYGVSLNLESPLTFNKVVIYLQFLSKQQLAKNIPSFDKLMLQPINSLQVYFYFKNCFDVQIVPFLDNEIKEYIVATLNLFSIPFLIFEKKNHGKYILIGLPDKLAKIYIILSSGRQNLDKIVIHNLSIFANFFNSTDKNKGSLCINPILLLNSNCELNLKNAAMLKKVKSYIHDMTKIYHYDFNNLIKVYNH